MPEQFWSARDTTPADIDSALRKLLQEHLAESRCDTPARVLNLIAIVDREWRGEISNRLERVGRYHASRTILCAVDAKRTTIDARATIVSPDGEGGAAAPQRPVADLGDQDPSHIPPQPHPRAA